MKSNKIMLFYFAALPISLCLRFLQLIFTVEPKTGFYIPESEGMGTVLLIVILLCSLFVALFARLTYKQPDDLPKMNIWLSASSALLSVSIFLETFFADLSLPILGWQNILLKVLSLACSIYLLAFASSPYLKFKIKPILSALPVIYSIIRLICDFTLVSKLAIISDNILLIAVYSLSMFFFLNFAKLYNGIDDDKNYKKILSYGLTLSVLCFTSSIPNLLLGAISSGYNHISLFSSITVLLIGIFATVFVFSTDIKN